MVELPTNVEYAKIAAQTEAEITSLRNVALSRVKNTDQDQLRGALKEVKQAIQDSKISGKEAMLGKIEKCDLKGVDPDTLTDALVTEAQTQGIYRKKNEFKELLLKSLKGATPEEINALVTECMSRRYAVSNFFSCVGDAERIFAKSKDDPLNALLAARSANKRVLEEAAKDPSLVRIMAVAEVINELKLQIGSKAPGEAEINQRLTQVQAAKDAISLMIGDEGISKSLFLQRGEYKIGGFIGALILTNKRSIAEATPLDEKEIAAQKTTQIQKEAQKAQEDAAANADSKPGEPGKTGPEKITPLDSKTWDFETAIGKTANPTKNWRGQVHSFGNDIMWKCRELGNPKGVHKSGSTGLALGKDPSDLMKQLQTGAAYGSPKFKTSNWNEVNLIYVGEFRITNVMNTKEKKADFEKAFAKVINDFMEDKTRDALPVCVAISSGMGFKPVVLWLRKSDLAALNKNH